MVVAHLRILLAIELGNAVGRVEAALRVASVSQGFVDAMKSKLRCLLYLQRESDGSAGSSAEALALHGSSD